MAGTVSTEVASLTSKVRDIAELCHHASDTGPVLDAVELIDLLHELETLKNVCSGVQAHAAVALRRLREEEARTAGRPACKVSVGVAAEIGLARRESPHRAASLLGLATVLVGELPRTMNALCLGRITEWRASLVARETACISRADRGRVDAELADRLTSLSDREVVTEARTVAYRLDPHSVVDRAARAEADRRVTIRPAPDSMAQVTALLPVAQGVAVYAALVAEADRLRAGGDPRSKGQVMADTLVARTTGQTAAPAVPLSIGLVMTDGALLADSSTPARLENLGPIPAAIARRLVADSSRSWVRRLYTHPDTGQLVAMEARRRLFPDTLKKFIWTRDEVCHTPWCAAPIRHADHVVPFRDGGKTSLANAQGLCERCNHTKEHLGWQARPGPDGSVITTTPTGHHYRSAPPALPHAPTRPRVHVDLIAA